MTRLTDLGGEAILIAGGGRAILLQIANPVIGAGVARHSDFANDPLRRLRNTLSYLYVLVYGSAAQRERVVSMVERAHVPVEHATDGELQLWVAATLYDTAALMQERVFGALSDEDAEAVYREYARVGTALQMPEELWPADRTAFRGYWDDAMAELIVTEEARRVAHDLLHPRKGPLWMRASMPLARLATAGLLDARLREQFGFPWSEGRGRRFDRLMRVTAVVYPRLPRALRMLPKNRLLAGL
jgi:uncharacterized protein (DUF2236 family)